METERIALSQRERDRLRVLHEIKRCQTDEDQRSTDSTVVGWSAEAR